MRYILTILFFFYIQFCSGKNIYISNGGSDSNNGLSTGAAWQTITKLNASWASVVANGDSILFRRGDTFTGQINVGKSVNFGAYLTGNKPIISGFETLTSWTLDGGNIWKTTPSIRLKRFCNILTLNSVPQAVGRYPNGTTFLTFQNATTTQLVSSSLSGQNWTNTEVVIRKIAYIAERAIVANQSGTTLTYGTTPQIDACPVCSGSANKNATDGRGFFFQRFKGSLDQQGEWYYTDTTQTMYLYSTVNPNTLTIKASYLDTLVNMNSLPNISVNNIKFEGANMNVFFNRDADGISIINCDFVNNTRVVNFHAVGLLNITGCTFDNTFNTCIFNYATGKNFFNINNNTFTNTGTLFGMGIFATEANLRVIYNQGSKTYIASAYQNIMGNTLTNTGSSGISYQGSNVIIRRNIITNFNNKLDDGGAIYSYIATATDNGDYRNRLIDSNFISSSVGALNGAGGSQSSCVYNDGFTHDVTIEHNTMYTITGTLKGNGVQTSNPKNVLVRNNTIYDADVCINVNIVNYAATPIFSGITNTRVENNILYQKTNATTKYIDRHINVNLNNPPLTIYQSLKTWFQDNNWISNQTAKSYTFYYAPPPQYLFKFYSLQEWRDTTLHDLSSILPPVALTNTNTTLYPNPSDVPLTVNFLGLRKIDPKGVIYDNFAVIPRWDSRLLIDNGSAPVGNIPPVANAGVNQTITLPTSSTSVTATATDADGTVVGYTWVKLAGSPPGGTITSPNSATTTITGLQQGTYIYQVTATDNLGATGTDQMQILVNPAPNILPTANAGADQTITLPTSTANLSGSGADTDGSIVSYAWVKLASSPSGGAISNANIAAPSLSGLIQGVYQYQLTVTDNDGGIGKDTVRITVNAAANIPPTANAGADQTITLPTSTTTISGLSSTDPDGTIVSYTWVKLAGSPAGGTLATPNSATTNVSALQFGTYTYRLTVTDNNGAQGTDQMQITVNNAPNIPPTANAGTDATITLPVNSTLLNGTGSSDPDGTIVSYSWTHISGPSGSSITSPTASTTMVTGLTQGVHVYVLVVTDNNGSTGQDFVQVTVNPAVPPVNQPPVAVAGADQVITLPTNSVSLNGTGSSDPDGTIVSYLWTKIGGPVSGTFGTPNASTTNYTGLTAGVYSVRLKVVDNNGDSATDVLQITVNPAINVNPTANAGANQTITLPTNSTTLTGSGTDPDGTITGYAWTQISGPNSAGITTPSSQNTGITGMIQGIYVFQLQVTDNSGGTGTDAVQVTVNSAPVNLPPTANAGIDQTTQLPRDSVVVVGSGNDVDGTIAGYAWTKISGPATFTIVTPTASTTKITGLVVGVYKFVLTVTDNLGLTGKDTIQITVIAANVLPTANAGANIIITAPANSTSFTGSGSDPDGSITGYHWVQLTGPNTSTIASPNSANTNISNLIVGDYIFELTVTDNQGGTGTDQIQVTVLAADILPTANAGANLAITLPINSVTLTGSGQDVDGTIVSYQWQLVSGPVGSNFGSFNAATTTFNNLTSISTTVAGVYQVRLTVTDNNGGTGSDIVQITVNPVPIPPSAVLLRGYKIN